MRGLASPPSGTCLCVQLGWLHTLAPILDISLCCCVLRAEERPWAGRVCVHRPARTAAASPVTFSQASDIVTSLHRHIVTSLPFPQRALRPPCSITTARPAALGPLAAARPRCWPPRRRPLRPVSAPAPSPRRRRSPRPPLRALALPSSPHGLYIAHDGSCAEEDNGHRAPPPPGR